MIIYNATGVACTEKHDVLVVEAQGKRLKAVKIFLHLFISSCSSSVPTSAALVALCHPFIDHLHSYTNNFSPSVWSAPGALFSSPSVCFSRDPPTFTSATKCSDLKGVVHLFDKCTDSCGRRWMIWSPGVCWDSDSVWGQWGWTEGSSVSCVQGDVYLRRYNY